MYSYGEYAQDNAPIASVGAAVGAAAVGAAQAARAWFGGATAAPATTVPVAANTAANAAASAISGAASRATQTAGVGVGLTAAAAATAAPASGILGDIARGALHCAPVVGAVANAAFTANHQRTMQSALSNQTNQMTVMQNQMDQVQNTLNVVLNHQANQMNQIGSLSTSIQNLPRANPASITINITRFDPDLGVNGKKMAELCLQFHQWPSSTTLRALMGFLASWKGGSQHSLYKLWNDPPRGGVKLWNRLDVLLRQDHALLVKYCHLVDGWSHNPKGLQFGALKKPGCFDLPAKWQTPALCDAAAAAPAVAAPVVPVNLVAAPVEGALHGADDAADTDEDDEFQELEWPAAPDNAARDKMWDQRIGSNVGSAAPAPAEEETPVAPVNPPVRLLDPALDSDSEEFALRFGIRRVDPPVGPVESIGANARGSLSNEEAQGANESAPAFAVPVDPQVSPVEGIGANARESLSNEEPQGANESAPALAAPVVPPVGPAVDSDSEDSGRAKRQRLTYDLPPSDEERWQQEEDD